MTNHFQPITIMNSSYQGLISSAADNTFQMEVLAVASGGNKELMHC